MTGVVVARWRPVFARQPALAILVKEMARKGVCLQTGYEIGSVIQRANNTEYDRHPLIFEHVALALRARLPEGTRPANILSFGCSSGEEAITLAEKYLLKDHIIGVDISDAHLNQARAANRIPERINFARSDPDFLARVAPFDVIFAMSVLCAWPDSEGKDDIASWFPFNRFARIVAELDQYLAKRGLLVIYNASFRFSDTDTYQKYRTVQIPGMGESGYVSKFNKDNRRCTEFDSYNEVLFEKISC